MRWPSGSACRRCPPPGGDRHAIWLTGALHEDGLADVADGFGGGRTLEDKLRIMRDPRIGSFGALALVLGLLARAGALAALAAPGAVAAALIAAAACPAPPWPPP